MHESFVAVVFINQLVEGTCNADDAIPAPSIWPSAVETWSTSNTVDMTEADMFVGISLSFCKRDLRSTSENGWAVGRSNVMF